MRGKLSPVSVAKKKVNNCGSHLFLPGYQTVMNELFRVIGESLNSKRQAVIEHHTAEKATERSSIFKVFSLHKPLKGYRLKCLNMIFYIPLIKYVFHGM